MEEYLIWQYFLFRMDVVALECFVHCENILWKYMFSGVNLDKSLGLLKRRLEKCGIMIWYNFYLASAVSN